MEHTAPPLLLAAFRHRFLGVVSGVGLLAAIGSTATLLHNGPLAMTVLHQYGNVEQVVLLQLFVGAACILTFPVSLAVAERSRLMSRMRESEARYRMLADHTNDLVMRLDGGGPMSRPPHARSSATIRTACCTPALSWCIRMIGTRALGCLPNSPRPALQ